MNFFEINGKVLIGEEFNRGKGSSVTKKTRAKKRRAGDDGVALSSSGTHRNSGPDDAVGREQHCCCCMEIGRYQGCSGLVGLY